MKTGRIADLMAFLKPGMTVFVQGAIAEPQDFTAALAADPARARGVSLWACLIPGINTFDYGAFADGPSFTTFMASSALESGIASGRTSLIPVPYSEIPAHLAAQSFDLAILHVTPPDAAGLCSFGFSSDSAPLVWRKAHRRIAFINPSKPRPRRAETIPASAIDLAIETDTPLLSPPRQRRDPNPAIARIAQHASALVPDGALIQSGIGEAPGAVIAALASRRDLRIRSGIVTDDYRVLHEAGALDTDRDQHATGVAWGSPDFYRWLAETDLCDFIPIPQTHNAEALARLPAFTSINSALEADFDGNLNVEWLGSRRISSVGGARDFMRAAQSSPGGRSIVAMPATAGKGQPRIVARLPPERITLPSDLADTIVTEHGAAEIKQLTGPARQEALRAIAAPGGV